MAQAARLCEQPKIEEPADLAIHLQNHFQIFLDIFLKKRNNNYVRNIYTYPVPKKSIQSGVNLFFYYIKSNFKSN